MHCSDDLDWVILPLKIKVCWGLGGKNKSALTHTAGKKVEASSTKNQNSLEAARCLEKVNTPPKANAFHTRLSPRFLFSQPACVPNAINYFTISATDCTRMLSAFCKAARKRKGDRLWGKQRGCQGYSEERHCPWTYVLSCKHTVPGPRVKDWKLFTLAQTRWILRKGYFFWAWGEMQTDLWKLKFSKGLQILIKTFYACGKFDISQRRLWSRWHRSNPERNATINIALITVTNLLRAVTAIKLAY